MAPRGPVLRQVGADTEILNDASGMPHASQFVAPDGIPNTLFVANAYGGFLRYTRGATGLSLVVRSEPRMPPMPLIYCNQLAVHAASATVYCTGLLSSTISLLDAATGVVRASLPDGDDVRHRGVAVHGDALYLASVERGLWRRPIRTDGTLGDPTRLLEGTFLHVVDLPTAVAAVERNGTVHLLPDDGSASARVDLVGPPLGVRVHGDELWVALGSQGVAVVDLTTRAVRRFPLDCVASAVDATADAVVVGCRQGLRLYARPAANANALGALLSNTRVDFALTGVLALAEGLYALDWHTLRRYEVTAEASAPVGVPEAPLGFTLPAGRSVRFEVHNPFATSQSADSMTLAPGQRAWFTAAPSTAGFVRVMLSGGRSIEVGAAVADAETVAPGGVLGLPYPNAWVYILQPDCALQWPDVEDLLWTRAHGGLGDGRSIEVVMLPNGSINPPSRYRALWSPLPLPMLSELLPLPDLPGRDLPTVIRRFNLMHLIGGPESTLFAATDADRRVVTMDTQYRGAFGLRVEALP